MSDAIAREVVVSGLVQGVFYRTSCVDEAVRRGVSGWVRNEPDGSVRALFEGAADDVQAMLEWCARGPRRAVVMGVETTERAVAGLTGFVIDQGIDQGID